MTIRVLFAMIWARRVRILMRTPIVKYKTIQGSRQEIEAQLNELAQDDWRPIMMTDLGVGGAVYVVILEKSARGKVHEAAVEDSPLAAVR